MAELNPRLFPGRAGWWVLLPGFFALGLLLWWVARDQGARGDPIPIGLLHAMTGPMAISEKPMVEAELLAIEEINAAGGVLGRPVTPLVADTQTDPERITREAERLLNEDRVSAIIGCWTSACRKTVKPIIERQGSLFIYPMAYEGLEISPNIIYTGAAPNQQVLPAVNWSFENLGTRFFLVGSDYIWPHSVNEIVRDQLKALGGEVVGEAYMPLGSLDTAGVVERILASRPDVILSTVVGDSNAPFYRALKSAGLSAERSPVISFSIGENELQTLPAGDLVGHYTAWCYFQGIERPENEGFVSRFRKRYGANRVVSDVMETAYFSTWLWAQGAKRAYSTDPREVGQALLGLSFNAPEGIVSVDPSTRHTWRSFNMGKIRADGGIQSVWSADYPIRPVPYPRTRSVKEWDDLIGGFYRQWNNSWINPGVPSGEADGS